MELTVVKENGGVVVLFEKDADVKLVDHTRKNLPPDTYESPRQTDGLHVAHLGVGPLSSM